MAGLFDFEQYYTEKVIKTDIKLDVSQLPLKSVASSSSVNEDGSVDDVDMNEYVTNNVMYRINSVIADGNELGMNDSICIVSTRFDAVTGHREFTETYVALGDPLDDLVSAGVYQIPESRARITPFVLTVGQVNSDDETEISQIRLYSNGTTVDVVELTVSVIARMRLINEAADFRIDPYSIEYQQVNQNFWHQNRGHEYTIYGLAATGLLGSIYKTKKWYSKQLKGNASAVYRYDSFVKMIDSLSKTAKDNNLGIKTTFYDNTYADPVELTGTAADKQLLRNADWTATDISKNAKFKDVYKTNGPLEEFVDTCHTHNPDPLPDIQGESATAIIPNVCDVFKKLYYPKDELAQDFTDNFFDTYSSIMGIKGVRRFMSSSIKKKLSRMQFKLKRVASEHVYALDMNSCINYLEAMFNYSVPQISYGLIWNALNPYDIHKCGIRMFSTAGFESIYGIGACNRKRDGSEYLPGETVTSPVYLAVSYQNFVNASTVSRLNVNYWGGRLHRMMYDDTYADWQCSYSRMTVGSMKQQLCDFYAGQYNEANDLDAGDKGFIKCEYSVDEQKFYVTVCTDDGDIRVPVNASFVDDAAVGVIASNVISTPELMSDMASIRGSISYGGSVAQYADSCISVIAALKSRSESLDASGFVLPDNSHYTVTDPNSASCSYSPTGTISDTEYINVIDFDEASVAGDTIAEYKFEPSYETLDDFGDVDPNIFSIQDCVDFVDDVMDDAVEEIDDILTVQGLMLGPTFLLIQKLRLSDTKELMAQLKLTISHIEHYQRITNESVFDNKTFIGKRSDYNFGSTPYLFMPARFLVPVLMYKRVKVKYKRWGRTRHKMVKRSIGVRWCEITFVDNDVYEAYPQNGSEPRQFYPINKTAHIATLSTGQTVFEFDGSIEGDTDDLIAVGKVSQFNHGSLVLIDSDGAEVDVVYDNVSTFVSNSIVDGIPGDSVFVYGIWVPLEDTAKSDDRTKVRVEYKMPYIPYDSELRKWAFVSYGAFDQNKYASETREVPSDPDEKNPGWQIFNSSSKRIGDLRTGMGIYDAAAILVGILRNSFGVSCVEVVETMRSKEDQELMCAGGGESTFLSWHNYGLAMKILINNPATGMPIEDGSPEMLRLIDIAEAYTIACSNGAFGKPLNIVWCGRLKTGANNFVWEFLPIGVGHKDIVNFRDATLNQEDPVATFGFVNVDREKLVYQSKPSNNVPYILSSSSAYRNAIVVNGEHYVSPRHIRNYSVPQNIVLINILEFCNLIRTKMEANGSSLNARANMYEWKALNDNSYRQLLIYYGLTGSINAAKALACGEYVEMYKDIVDHKYSENFVEMVKDYLGNLYHDVKIYIEESADGGAWLSLSDGKLHIKTTDIRPTYDQNSKDNFFGEKIAPLEWTERGLYVDGVFRTEDELLAMGYQVEHISDESYIDGYENGVAVGDDAMLLHSLVATQIKEEFDKLKETFENYGGGIMYDHFVDGPNVSMSDMLENEFGLIASQDLIEFDNLRAIFAQKNIEANAARFSDGTIQGAGGEGDIFEKVVSNAELAGVRKASLTKEHINVTIQPNTLSTEQLYKLIMEGGMTRANDMFTK